MTAKNLPDAARTILKGVIMSLANAGVIANTDAENLIAALGIGDA